MVYEHKVRELFAAGKYLLDDIVCFEVDRADGLTYAQKITPNVCPTLTTNSNYFWFADVRGIIEAVPDEEREIFRLLMPCERLGLQGFRPSAALDLTPGACAKAAGNAYPPPLIIAVLHGMLEAVGNHHFDFRSWPPASALASPTCPQVAKGVAALETALKKGANSLQRKANNAAKKKAEAPSCTLN
jgi:hypothetical protein